MRPGFMNALLSIPVLGLVALSGSAMASAAATPSTPAAHTGYDRDMITALAR